MRSERPPLANSRRLAHSRRLAQSRRLAIGTSLLLLYLVPGQREAQAQHLDDLLEPAASVDRVADGFTFVEGPLWVASLDDSYLLFSDIPENRVYRYSPGSGEVSVFLEPVKPPDSPSDGVGGSNGLALDPSGRLVLCEHGNRRVARLEADGSRTTLAERYQGKRLNSPNDIVFHSSGDAYFTDPSYGLREQSAGKEISWNGVYRLLGAATATADPLSPVELLHDRIENPNGIGLSPDEETLYVANSSVSDPIWMAFPVQADGSLGQARLHFDGSKLDGPGVPDGFAVDERGNLWASGPGGIVVISPRGEHLGTIEVPEVPANAAFGGEHGRSLYITARTGLYRIETLVRGFGVATTAPRAQPK